MAGGIPTTNLQVPTTQPTVPQPTVLQPTATPYNRQQQIGLALSALSDVLGKRDPIAGTMQRQAFLQAQQQMAEQEKKQEELNKQLNSAIDKSNLPQSQKDLFKKFDVQTKAQALMKTFEPPKTLSTAQRVSEIAAKVANDPNYKLTPQDELILQISRKADPLTRGIEDISAAALSEFTQEKGTLKTYASTQDALNAGLQSGDQFIGTDGVTYRIP